MKKKIVEEMSDQSVEESEIRALDLEKHIKNDEIDWWCSDASLKKPHVKVHPSLCLHVM